jgi:hypothetical protein
MEPARQALGELSQPFMSRKIIHGRQPAPARQGEAGYTKLGTRLD